MPRELLASLWHEPVGSQPSAAQNGTVLTACPKCGAANDEHAQECYVCGATCAFEEEAIEREAPAAVSDPPPAAPLADAIEPAAAPATTTRKPRAPRKPRVRATPVVAISEPASSDTVEINPVEAPAARQPEREVITLSASALMPASPGAEGRHNGAATPTIGPEVSAALEPFAGETEESLRAQADAIAAAIEEVRAAAARWEPGESEEVEPEPAVQASQDELEEEQVAAAMTPEELPDGDMAEVIGFAPPVAALAASAARDDADHEDDHEMEELREDNVEAEPVTAAPAMAATDGTSALNPSPRIKQMPRPTTAARPVPEPEWRREVARRLENYRARRSRSPQAVEPAAQSPLPFDVSGGGDGLHQADSGNEIRRPMFGATAAVDEFGLHGPENPGNVTVTLDETAELPASAAGIERRLDSDHIEIAVPPPQFDFVLLDDDAAHPQSELIPVVELRERSRAGMLDLAFLALTYTGFLLMFRTFGGHLTFGKQEAIVYALTFFLFYALYFSLFTICGGATPGMYFRGLAAVSFDGRAPETGQLLRRAFGYAVSGGTLALGFLWSLWDEDRLTWHDRMSQTYLTRAETGMWSDFPGEDSYVGPEGAESGEPSA